MKYFIYARKSSEAEDRQVQSIDSQIKTITDLKNKLDLQITDTLTESKSAKYPGREVFDQLIKRINAGEANGILVWHPDRLSRNPADSATIVSLIDSGKLLEVITPNQTFRNNPMDKFMLGFLMLQAKLENDNKSVNVKRGLLAKAEKGWLPAAAKPGYMNSKNGIKGNEYNMKDPIRFPLIRKCWDLMLIGQHSPPAILNLLNNDWGYRTIQKRQLGNKPMSRSQIYNIFSDTFYYGEYEYPCGSNKWYKGLHEPMITKDEFDKVQILLGRKGFKRPKKKNFPYTGLIKCGNCGESITCEEKWQVICTTCKNKFSTISRSVCSKCNTDVSEMHNPKILHYIYYHCIRRKNPKCTEKSILISDLENQIDGLLSTLGINDAFKDWALKYLNQINDTEVNDRNAIYQSLQLVDTNCVSRLDNLVKLYISPQNTDRSLLTDDDLKNQKNAILKERAQIKEKMSNFDNRILKWMDKAESDFNFATRLRYRYINGFSEDKSLILSKACSNITIKDKKLCYTLQEPYFQIKTMVSKNPTTSEMFEPIKEGVTTTQMEVSWSQNPSMYPVPDSNRRFSG